MSRRCCSIQQVGNVLAEANCIKGLGDIALARADQNDARVRYGQALMLYQHISELYSLGITHRQLARLASNTGAKQSHVVAAITAWQQMKRNDLIAEIKSEFAAIS